MQSLSMVSLKESGSVLRDWSGQERPPRGETFKMMLKVERASLVAQRVERASLVAQRVKCLPAMQETWVQSLGQEDPLKKEMATHSSTLAWKIP